jgi:sugar lactone lactonase YvrE
MYSLRGTSLLLALSLVAACSGEDSTDMGHDASMPNTDGGTGDGDADACPSTGTGSLQLVVDIATGVSADVKVAGADGSPVTGSPFAAATTIMVTGGHYEVSAGRVLKSGEVVGAAYQGAVTDEAQVCVRDGMTTIVHIEYTEEPGSQKLWLTNSNGTGQILGLANTGLRAAGTVAPAVTLDGKLTSPSALRVDALGRLWVGDLTGKLVAFATDRLGANVSAGPDITLDGAALCEEAAPCGPRAIAFDKTGAMWVATLSRIVKLTPESLSASGQPGAAVTITSTDIKNPASLAFDADGNLWVGDDAENGVAEFKASRLTANIAGPADIVLHGQTSGPVTNDFSQPDGLVFDKAGELWVGYFAGNNLVKYTAAERAHSATLKPATQFAIGTEALVTDLAVDEAGNLWMPGGAGSVYRIDAAQLSAPTPALVAIKSAAIGNAEKIALHSVSGPLFIAP